MKTNERGKTWPQTDKQTDTQLLQLLTAELRSGNAPHFFFSFLTKHFASFDAQKIDNPRIQCSLDNVNRRILRLYHCEMFGWALLLLVLVLSSPPFVFRVTSISRPPLVPETVKEGALKKDG